MTAEVNENTLLLSAPSCLPNGPEAVRCRQQGRDAERHGRRRDDVRVVPRSPELDERWVLPDGRFGPLDARVDRQKRRSGHAVLQAGPRRAPERAASAWEPLVERADVQPEREDLRPREFQLRSGHCTLDDRALRRGDDMVPACACP